MAALTESPAVESSNIAANRKESNGDHTETSNQAVPVRNPDVSDENVCSSDKSAKEVSSEESENKPKFIEAPIPKVNPWTVMRNGPQSAGQLKPSSRHQLLGE